MSTPYHIPLSGSCPSDAADLGGATLSDASLFWANLTGAQFALANLTDARFFWANLTGARLGWVNLADANPDLTGIDADLARGNADLGGEVNLTRADFSGADLTGARLGKADLAMAENLIQQQLDSARGNDQTKLPARLQRPAHWSAGPAPPSIDQ